MPHVSQIQQIIMGLLGKILKFLPPRSVTTSINIPGGGAKIISTFVDVQSHRFPLRPFGLCYRSTDRLDVFAILHLPELSYIRRLECTKLLLSFLLKPLSEGRIYLVQNFLQWQNITGSVLEDVLQNANLSQYLQCQSKYEKIDEVPFSYWRAIVALRVYSRGPTKVLPKSTDFPLLFTSMCEISTSALNSSNLSFQYIYAIELSKFLRFS